jgi:CRP-like cAMP-binding protein
MSRVPHQLYVDCCEPLRMLLSGHEFFRESNSGYLNMVVPCMHEAILLPGDVLHQAGEPAKDMYWVRHGTFISISFSNQKDEGVVTGVHSAGSSFGTIGLLVDVLRSNTVLAEATEDQASVVVSLSRQAVEEPLEVYPEQAEILHQARQRALREMFADRVAALETGLIKMLGIGVFWQDAEGDDRVRAPSLNGENSSKHPGGYGSSPGSDHDVGRDALAGDEDQAAEVRIDVGQLHALLLAVGIIVPWEEAERIVAENSEGNHDYLPLSEAKKLLLGGQDRPIESRRVASFQFTPSRSPSRFGIGVLRPDARTAQPGWRRPAGERAPGSPRDQANAASTSSSQGRSMLKKQRSTASRQFGILSRGATMGKDADRDPTADEQGDSDHDAEEGGEKAARELTAASSEPSSPLGALVHEEAAGMGTAGTATTGDPTELARPE